MMTLEDCRFFYAQEVRWAANLTSPALIGAYARVPREKYLGPPPWQIGSADLRALTVSTLGGPAQRKPDEPRDPAKQGPDATGKPLTMYRSTENPQDLYHNVVVALDAARDLNNGQPSALALWIEALSGGLLFEMKSIRTDPHEPSEACLVHGPGVCVSSAETAAAQAK